MKYTLNTASSRSEGKKTGTLAAFKKLFPLLAKEKKILTLAFAAIIINSILNLLAPVLIGHTVDTYIITKEYSGVLLFSGILLGIFLASTVVSYWQTTLMGGVGQRLLFNLRNSVFNKLQELPVAFFNQNKAGDLISRINNDTDKLNQFFSQSLVQFIANIFMIVGAGGFIIYLNFKLGVAALLPAVGLLFFTMCISAYVKRKNAVSLDSTGNLSAEIQESLNNFKVIVAFDRRDYFKKKFNEANTKNYEASIGAGIVNTVFLLPIYTFIANTAQLIILSYGIYLIVQGSFTIGLLISYLTYVTRVYDPLRQIAALWAQFQVALAGWDRITDILSLENDLKVVPSKESKDTTTLLEFKNVNFGYIEDTLILQNINFKLEAGKTYALVGPTGGGKTTTASLMARLYDPTAGTVYLHGQDIRSYTSEERASKIGFILQEPFLFTGTVRDNIVYGNEKLQNHSSEELLVVLREAKLEELVTKFNTGLETKVGGSGEVISLGQKQLIAFIRAVLRQPELLILDEATANIDTVTEALLQEILNKLPAKTTRVVIAHRLNTIENADEIFFVNGGHVTEAGSLDHAVEMLMRQQRSS